eukprot:12754192-Prorocentrum_lima.AAC.1
MALVSARCAFGWARRARAGVETNPMSSKMKGMTSLPYCLFSMWLPVVPRVRGISGAGRSPAH